MKQTVRYKVKFIMKRILMAIFAGLGAALAIAALSYPDAEITSFALLMAPFGATTVLVFGVPASPLAQPKNVIFGHLITGFIGIAFYQYIGVTPLTLAMATGMAVTAMLLANATHPPAGANPILIMLTSQDWWFLLTPILIGAVVIVLVGKLMTKLSRQVGLNT